MKQVDFAGRPVHGATYEIILLANNCRDADGGRCSEASP